MKDLFSVDGPIVRFLTNVMDLILLNVLTILCCLPLVTGGAALAALHYVLMQMRAERGDSRSRTFFHQFRANLKDTVPVWLFFFAGAALMAGYYMLFIYQKEAAMWVFFPIIIGAVVLSGLSAWLFPLMARFENPFSVTLRNAAILAVGYAPRTIGMIAAEAGILFLFIRIFILWPFFFLFGISLPAYLASFLYFPVIEGMVKQVLGEEYTEPSGPAGEEDEWTLDE